MGERARACRSEIIAGDGSVAADSRVRPEVPSTLRGLPPVTSTSTQPFRRPVMPRGNGHNAPGPRTAVTESTPRQVQLWLDVDDGSSIAVRGRGLVGRHPSIDIGQSAEHLIKLVDDKLSVSRTHLEFGVDGSRLWVRDLGSTNGSALEVNGRRTTLDPEQQVSAPPGSTIHVGRRQLRVRAMNGRSVVGSATLDWGVATHTGPRHEHNEDSAGTQAPAFLVADGIGGHAAGEVASREAIDALSALAGSTTVSSAQILDCLADARARIARIPTGGGPPPGTTLTGVVVTHDDDGVPNWMVLNLGDSRTYQLVPNGVQQLTVDHSIAQELIKRDPAKFAEARSFRYGNTLTRALVAHVEHEPDIWTMPMRRGDRILICSDGLTRELDDKAIASVLRTLTDPLTTADILVNAAAQKGARDDVTALVVDAVAITPEA